MLNVNLNEVEIVDDNISKLETLKNVINKTEADDSLHLLDLGNVLKKYQDWSQKMPRVLPYFAMKSNPEPTILKLLSSLGVSFDCASKEEIVQLMGLGVPSDRIIFANPVKFPTHLKYARKVGVALMTADHEIELKKIKEIYPEAKVVIRIRCDSKTAMISLGEKFGCDPEKEAINLIKVAMKLNLELSGFAFHVGTLCDDVDAFCREIRTCNNLIQTARFLGCKTANIIDIGGGFPGDRNFDLDELTGPINDALEKVDLSIKIIAEPGRYFVTSAVTIAAQIISKKIAIENGKKKFMYYVTDGIYGSFACSSINTRSRRPRVLNPICNTNKKYISTIWGPTCDSRDCILKEELLPEYYIGEWLIWYDLGAYTACFSSKFNGFKPPRVYSIMHRSDWKSMQMYINKKNSK